MKIVLTVVATLMVVVLAGLGVIYAGAFDFAADQPHSALVYGMIDLARDRYVLRASRNVHTVPPVLGDKRAVEEGAEHYAAMCTGCHLAPGMAESDARTGMYPQPPKLAGQPPASPAEQFWIIKHGIKASGMPAWGRSHDDASIWNIVAFLQQLPTMSEARYRELTGSVEGEPAEEHHHEH